MKVYAIAAGVVAFVNKVVLGGSFAKLITWFTATRIQSFATALGFKGLAASAGLAASGVGKLTFSLKLFRLALVSTGIGENGITGLGLIIRLKYKGNDILLSIGYNGYNSLLEKLIERKLNINIIYYITI